MHDRAMLAEFFDLSGDPIIEANADRQEKVSFVGGIVGIDRPMHAKPFERKRMVLKPPMPISVVVTGI